MRFNLKPTSPDNPCKPDCQDRSATCHATCERYKAFEAKKMDAHAAANLRYDFYDYKRVNKNKQDKKLGRY